MDFDLQNASASLALAKGTLLHDRYRILGTLSVDEQSIIYEAADGADNIRVCIREYCPMNVAIRSGEWLMCDEEHTHEFLDGGRQFVRLGKLLQRGIPHVAPVTALFNTGGTSYIVNALPEGMTLSDLHAPLTATYVQSLGTALCDSLQALHDAGLCYGAISEKHLCFKDNGEMVLSAEPIRLSGSKEEDLLGLREFLRSLMPPGESDDPASAAVRAALTARHSSAAAMRSALLGGKIGVVKKRSGIPSLILCLLFLAGSVYAVSKVPRREVQLAAKVETGNIKPQVVSVWAPLAEGTDEKEVCAMYEKLAAGFEKQHPGCGVRLRLYADDSFTEAITQMDTSDEIPVVIMDSQDPVVREHAADLTNLTFALQDVYVADMSQFTVFVPLSCSLPALLYNEHKTPELGGSGSLRFAELPPNTLYDLSAAQFIEAQHAKQQPTDQLEAFLNDGRTPILASSSCLADARRTAASAGAVHMLPVSVDGKIPLQYEMYCSVNSMAAPASQQVGMLWLQYLLTEEAQEILFVEHYSDLPLHKTALRDAAALRKELNAAASVLGLPVEVQETEAPPATAAPTETEAVSETETETEPETMQETEEVEP